jgi:hyperosmotically inducible protein
MKKTVASALVALSSLAMFATFANAQSTPNSAMSSTAPDNTRNNKVDQSSTSINADSQSNAPGDIDMTKRIRQSVMADKTLSTYAHNVKIVTVNGGVTLMGVVRSDQERDTIAMKAAAIAGQDKVTNRLRIASEK